MAFGKHLDDADSATIRTILKDATVTSLTFWPLDTGFAEYGTIEVWRGEGRDSDTIQRDHASFEPLMAVVEAHDYPHEFNDKFFVELVEVTPIFAIILNGNAIGGFATQSGATTYLTEVISLSNEAGVKNGAYTVQRRDNMFEGVPTLTFSMDIENAYTDFDPIDTRVVDGMIPAPENLDDLEDWQAQYLNDFTGAGHVEGDSFYDMTITECSVAALVGQTFDWGY